MIPYQKEKIENAICFFAQEHKKHSRNLLHQTFLYKYLALFDFGYLKEYGKAPLGLKYLAMQRGPVPTEIYNHRDDPRWSDLFSFQKDPDGHYMINSKLKPDLSYFSKRELKFMNRLIEIYARNYVTSKLMSDVSHQEILAWKRTWTQKPNSIIDYSLEFKGNVFAKSDDELTFSEEVYLIQQGIEHCI